MVEPLPPTATADLPPDWSTISHDLVCPLCTYNLRGLIDPRCPECGYTFTWSALQEACRAAHPYLFEHYPHRTLWSFTRTTRAGFRPSSFWSRLSPAHRIHTNRLLLYWLVHTALLLIAAAAVFGIAFYTTISSLNTTRASARAIATAGGMFSQQWLNLVYPPPGSWRWLKSVSNSVNPELIPFVGLLLLWPWLTFLSLLIFQQSMRKSRIRPAQIFRCCIYAGDAALPIFLAILAFNFLTIVQFPATQNIQLDLLPFIFLLYASYRLLIAYKTYLRFDHVIATILASQIIVALIGWKLVFIWAQN
ncbi:MAG TPA: hypothetical protein VFE58_17725 [Tepidisphaeraceae bacterium]|jgi:hypothetical protein|nr:hypothetical protein [Tepidisphaeraceae bacterium]